MGCQRDDCENRDRDRGGDRGKRSGGCVKDTVRRILDAQREADRGPDHGCRTSCERSIEDLLSPSRDHHHSRHTTIPFMLTCRDGCSNFVGSGFKGRHGHYECIESPVFKVKGFVRGSDSCVRLELLSPVYRRHGHKAGGEEDFSEAMGGHSHHNSCGGSVCNFFNHRHIENFCYTGVCITVDLDCFCGISCLDAMTPSS